MPKLKYIGQNRESFYRLRQKRVNISVDKGDVITVEDWMVDPLLESKYFEKVVYKPKVKKGVEE